MRKSLKTPIPSIEKVDTQKTGNKAIKKNRGGQRGIRTLGNLAATHP